MGWNRTERAGTRPAGVVPAPAHHGYCQAPARWQGRPRDSRRVKSLHAPVTSGKTPVVEPPAPLERNSSGRRAHEKSRLPPSLQNPQDPGSPMRTGSPGGYEHISPGNNGARPNRARWCHRRESRSSMAISTTPRRGRRPRPRHELPASPDYFVSARLYASTSTRAGPAPPRRRRETRKVRRPC